MRGQKSGPRRASGGNGKEKSTRATFNVTSGLHICQDALLAELDHVSELPEVLLELKSIRNHERALKLGILLLESQDWRVAS